ATGHLDPFQSLGGFSYLKSHFELIMWPLSMLYWLNRNDGLTLLILQDLSVVFAEAIALGWVIEVATKAGVPRALRGAIAGATLLLFVSNPWIWRSAAQDFHFESIAACFALATAWDLWAGRYRRCAIWVALGLCSGDLGATYQAAVGLGFLFTVR